MFSQLNDCWNISSSAEMLVSIYFFTLGSKGSEILEENVDEVRRNIIFHIISLEISKINLFLTCCGTLRQVAVLMGQSLNF